MKVAFLKDGKEGTSRHFGDLKNLRNPPKLIGISGKARRQLRGLPSLSERLTKAQSEGSL